MVTFRWSHCTFLILLPVHTLDAQVPWTPTEVAARFAEQNGTPRDASTPPAPAFAGIVYGERFPAIARFLVGMQERPPIGIHRGGLWTDESHIATDAALYIQTADTTQAIWVWSHTRERTGDRSYDPNLAMAWQYVRNNPAWFEEGGSSEFGYYRVYNAAWGLLAEHAYRHATGDASQLVYAQACATYLVSFPLRLTGMLNVPLHADTEGFAMAALHRFGVEQGDTQRIAYAVQRAQILKQLAERNPTWLGMESWALSGGCLFLGVLEAAFGSDPEGRRLWADQYDEFLKPMDRSGTWHDAHNAWYALAHAASWRLGALPDALTRHRALLDHLLARDGDDDAGIPADATLGDDDDASWVTSLLALGGLEPVEEDLDLRLEPERRTLAGNVPLRLELAWANHLPTPENSAVFLLVSPPGGGPVLLGSRATALAGREVTTTGVLEFPLPPGTPRGAWSVDAYLFGRNARLSATRSFPFVLP